MEITRVHEEAGAKIRDTFPLKPTSQDIAEFLEATYSPLIAESQAVNKELLEALEQVKAWFIKLEDGTEDDDPLRAIRKKYHAPIHAIMDAAIAKARVTK